MKKPNVKTVTIDLQHACETPDAPSDEAFHCWVSAALAGADFPVSEATELTIRIVDSTESAELNETWRHHSGPTNVLSFPFESPPGVDLPLLGDLVICAEKVRTEAAEQHKTLESHWAHLTIHGVLHLLGYDHIEDADAERMETLEIQILAQLGYANPYELPAQAAETKQ